MGMLTEAAPGGGYYYKKAKKPAPAPAPATRTADVGNLVEVAQKLDGFKTLVGLVVELGLVDRHVIAGKTVKAADVPTASIGTFGGENIDLVKDDAGVGVSYSGGARSNVIIADVEANNGV